MTSSLPRLYGDLASWYPLLSAPSDYEEEAAFFLRVFAEALGEAPATLLELGCGGGGMAYHYKHHIRATLTDISHEMLNVSRAFNPECEHLPGDMCTLRLGRQFDAVLVHDAICYLLTEEALLQAMSTAFVHLRPGGVAIFAPDYVRETFAPRTDCGGHDGDGRALRYLEWMTDPDPADNAYAVDYVYLLREGDAPPRVEYERHIEGLFPRGTWLALLQQAGFETDVLPREAVEPEFGDLEIFVSRRP